jgi:hypothetical protein
MGDLEVNRSLFQKYSTETDTKKNKVIAEKQNWDRMLTLFSCYSENNNW